MSQRVRLQVADVAARHLGIEHTIDDPGDGPLVVRMPAWCPGSYVLREYAGHVTRFTATDADGGALSWHKRDKATWEIAPEGAPTVVLRYRVFAPELTVRSNDVSHDHAFVHPPAAFFAVEGRTDEAIDLHVDPPTGWTVSTALDPHGDGYRAHDYDRLADCPLEIGPHDVHHFEVAGRRHEFVIHGSGNHDVERIVADTEKIVRTEVDFFGGEPPYDRYLFVLHLTHDRGGGLEHDDSCALAWPKLGFRPEKQYRKFLTLVAHEFFHVWNVRRIRPEALLPYDYAREAYTTLLWVFEGFTTYYDELFPVRAGCYDTTTMLDHLAELIGREASRPGGSVQSLAESSFDAWIGLYRPNPDTPNSQTNYYLKGLLVAWKLDLFLRRETDDAHSLDDVVRHLWHEYGQRGRGVPEDGMVAIVREATGVDVTEFVRAHVERPGRMEYDDVLAHVGLRLRRKPVPEDEETPAWIGATLEPGDSGTRLAQVFHGGPAHAAGLMAGDVVIALDDHRIGRDLDERLKILRPGETVRWTAFRRDRLVQGRMTLGEDPVGTPEIVPLEGADPARRASFERWTGRSFEESAGRGD
ncbi:MAG TPA: PDZ domain-containing protein [Candidatus Krumholzibacteria bacterium]|nr:PDZ domain-containing protein [Candidatus Krumholzibacteria bacterium]